MESLSDEESEEMKTVQASVGTNDRVPGTSRKRKLSQCDQQPSQRSSNDKINDNDKKCNNNDEHDDYDERNDIKEVGGQQNFMPSDGSRFLLLHLRILSSLYDDPLKHGIGSGQNSVQSTPQDGQVDKKWWELIKRFLRERDNLVVLAERVASREDIHAEALRFMEEEIKECSPSDESSGYYDLMDNDVSANFGIRTPMFPAIQPSPRLPRYGSARSSSGSYQSDMGNEINAFGFMSGLLHRKSTRARENLQTKLEPFQELASEVEERIRFLKSFLSEQGHDAHMVVSGGNGRRELQPASSQHSIQILSAQSIVENDEEAIASAQVKLNLWSMLLNDLRSIG